MNPMNHHQFDVKNLCSRKLWELLLEQHRSSCQQVQLLEQELLQRRHYVNELLALKRNSPTHVTH